MSKKSFVLLPLFACSLLLIMGALNDQPRPFAPALEASFVAQPVPCEAPLANLPASQVLARAIAKLAPATMPWLRVQIWQKQRSEEMSFEAEGTLVSGPNHCARLEMTVRASQGQSSVVVVSDGVGIAHANKRSGQPVDLETRALTSGQTAMSPKQIADTFAAHGCGGPYRLLQELASHLENLDMTTGIWKDQKVVRLSGQVKSKTPVNPDKDFTIPPRVCVLYLDAQTLWPLRIEWWGAAPPIDPSDLLLQVEFRRPTINQPLSHEECVREFSYQPEE